MSTKNDLSSTKLTAKSDDIISYFGSKEELQSFWLSHSRRELSAFSIATFNISFYYFKKIALDILKIRDKTFEESEQIRNAHRIATNIKRFGVAHNWSSKDPKLNGRKTMLERYGVERNSQTKAWKESVNNTWNNKTDEEKLRHVETILAGKHGARHQTHKYKCNGIYFDSFPELAFYIYNVVNSTGCILREPTVLKFNHNGKSHCYIPDFSIDGKLYEIKAKHWLDLSDKNSLDYAKYECMLANNVTILFEDGYKKYIDWFNSHEWNKNNFTAEGLAERSDTAAMADLLN